MGPQLDPIQGDSGILTVRMLEFALRIVLRTNPRSVVAAGTNGALVVGWRFGIIGDSVL